MKLSIPRTNELATRALDFELSAARSTGASKAATTTNVDLPTVNSTNVRAAVGSPRTTASVLAAEHPCERQFDSLEGLRSNRLIGSGDAETRAFAPLHRQPDQLIPYVVGVGTRQPFAQPSDGHSDGHLPAQHNAEVVLPASDGRGVQAREVASPAQAARDRTSNVLIEVQARALHRGSVRDGARRRLLCFSNQGVDFSSMVEVVQQCGVHVLWAQARELNKDLVEVHPYLVRLHDCRHRNSRALDDWLPRSHRGIECDVWVSASSRLRHRQASTTKGC